MLGLGVVRLHRPSNRLDVVAPDRDQPQHPFGPERGDDARRATTPVVAAHHGPLDAERVEETEQVCPQRRLLAGAESLRGQEPRRTVATQVRDEHPAALRERRRDAVVGPDVVREAVEEHHRYAAGDARLLVGDLESGGAGPSQHALSPPAAENCGWASTSRSTSGVSTDVPWGARALDRRHRWSQRLPSGASRAAGPSLATVVSFFTAAGAPAPTQNPARRSVTRVRVDVL